MAQFGVTTALTSIVLSVFMAGLGAGSWFAGALLHRYRDRINFPPLRLYALLELLIGLSALVVPAELVWGHRLLETLADRAAVSSAAYYLISGLWLSAAMIPFCACMGATIPVAMFAIRNRQQEADNRSFSFLYLANVMGAVLGAFLPLLLIEPYGFHKTLRIGAALNVAIAVSAFAVSLASRPVQPPAATLSEDSPSEISFGPTQQPQRCPGPAVHHRLGHHGYGVDMDSALHALYRPGGLFLWHDPGGLPVGDVCGIADLPQLEPHPQARKPAHMDIAGTARNTAAAYCGCSRPFTHGGAGVPGCHALRRDDRIPYAHAGGPLVARRS